MNWFINGRITLGDIATVLTINGICLIVILIIIIAVSLFLRRKGRNEK